MSIEDLDQSEISKVLRTAGILAKNIGIDLDIYDTFYILKLAK